MTRDVPDEPRYHYRGCPQHVNVTQRTDTAIVVWDCTCGGRDPDAAAAAELAADEPEAVLAIRLETVDWLAEMLDKGTGWAGVAKQMVRERAER